MSTPIPIPVGSYVTNDPTVSCKRLVNVFSEPIPADSVMEEIKGGNPIQQSAPSYLRRWAGLTQFATNSSGNPVRGLWTMLGVLYAVIGPNLYSVTSSGALTLLGSGIPGSSFVRMTDNDSCLVILVPGTTFCYTYCPNAPSAPLSLSGVVSVSTTGDFTCSPSPTALLVGQQITVTGTFLGTGNISGFVSPTTYKISSTNGSSSFTLQSLGGATIATAAGTTTGADFSYGTAQAKFQQLTASLFLTYGAIDCHFVDSYIVFLANNGRLFYNDDGQPVSGQGQITFNTNAIFPREFGTDNFVGMGVDHREITLFGLKTSEGYINVGNPVGTPFSTAPQSFVEMGCHPQAAYSIALQDQALFWVANDKTVRRKSGQTPTRVSNSGIEAILEHANLAGSYALTPSIGGHPLWIYVMPAAFRTIVYDCLTQEWFELESYNLGYYRGLCYENCYGYQFIGDSQGNGIGYLDTTVFAEFGSTMVASFTTQGIYNNHNRINHRRLEIILSTGQGGYTGALLSLWVSDDGGNYFRGFPIRNLGSTGNYWVRATWFNLGQSRNRVYRFSISDPTPIFTVQITSDMEQCKW